MASIEKDDTAHDTSLKIEKKAVQKIKTVQISLTESLG